MDVSPRLPRTGLAVYAQVKASAHINCWVDAFSFIFSVEM